MQALARADIARLLEGTLDYEQQEALRKYAPTSLQLPSGGRAPLRYARESQLLAEEEEDDLSREEKDKTFLEVQSPTLAAKLQV